MLKSIRLMFSKIFLLCVISLMSWAGSSSVVLTINGLPQNTAAAVSLNSFDAGVRLYLNSSTTVNDLPSANYKATIIPVVANGLNYNPQDKEILFFLEENQNLSLTINYLQDTTVVRNPAVIQTAVARSLPIHVVMGDTAFSSTTNNPVQNNVQSTYQNNQIPMQQQQVIQQNIPQNMQGRSYLSNSNSLSSTGFPGVRPLPFALGNSSSLYTTPSTPVYSSPAQPS